MPGTPSPPFGKEDVTVKREVGVCRGFDKTEEVEGDDRLPALLLDGDRFVRLRRKRSTGVRPPASALH